LPVRLGHPPPDNAPPTGPGCANIIARFLAASNCRLSAHTSAEARTAG
jgi:hypothetical protein